MSEDTVRIYGASAIVQTQVNRLGLFKWAWQTDIFYEVDASDKCQVPESASTWSTARTKWGAHRAARRMANLLVARPVRITAP